MSKINRLIGMFIKTGSMGADVMKYDDLKEISISVDDKDENIRKISMALSFLGVVNASGK